jgi:hypothetical protein
MSMLCCLLTELVRGVHGWPFPALAARCFGGARVGLANMTATTLISLIVTHEFVDLEYN